MYPGIYTSDLLLAQKEDRRPIFYCEYSHSMGNSTGNIKEFWDQFRSKERLIGGCIWEFKDQGLYKTDSEGKQFLAYGGDFGEKYFDDFTIKGIVQADGTPHAAIYECKRVFQPVECQLIDALKGLVKVNNRHATRSLSDYIVNLKVLENGNEIVNIVVPSLKLEAGRDTVIDVLSVLPKQKPGKEYFLNISFRLKTDMGWAKTGHEVASSQFALSSLPVAEKTIQQKARLEIQEKVDLFLVSGKGFQLTFDKKNGALSKYISDDKEQICNPLLPGFTRPLTDNDRRGWKAQVKLKEWYNSKPVLKSFTINKVPSGEVKAESIYDLIDQKARIQVNYMINAKGIVKVDYLLKVTDSLPNIPRIGMTCGIADDYRQITWYGRGLHENYIDRCYGSDVGIFSLPIIRFMEPYVRPQENGNRTGVRWMYLSNPSQRGILVVADSLLSMSAWPYSAEAYQTARHASELKESGYITLNIDLIQMGVGGNDSWSEVAAPLEKYQVKAKNYAYHFYLFPVKIKNEQITGIFNQVKF
jgi:beta-galactosidase